MRAFGGGRGRIRRDSCQLGPRTAAVQGRDARFYGAARRVAASAERARRAAALAGAGAAVQGRDGAGARRWWVLRAGAMVGTADAAVVGAAVQGRRWWARRCGCCVRGGATVRGHGAAADATLVTALELTAQQARWKRVTVGCGESGLTRRNTPARVAAIRPNWRALPQRALRALR